MAASTPKPGKEMRSATENMDLKNDKIEKKIMNEMNQFLEKMLGKMKENKEID